MYKKPFDNEKKDDDDANKVPVKTEDDGERFLRPDYNFQDFAETVKNKNHQLKEAATKATSNP